MNHSLLAKIYKYIAIGAISFTFLNAVGLGLLGYNAFQTHLVVGTNLMLTAKNSSMIWENRRAVTVLQRIVLGPLIPETTPDGSVLMPRSSPKPSPMSLKEKECLTYAIYSEARSESTMGRLGVAFVVVNRAHDRRWPSTICSVVSQPHQFSGYRDSFNIKAIFPDDIEALEQIKQLVDDLEWELSYHDSPLRQATHFVSTGIDWKYASKLTKVATIGGHRFFT